MRTRSITDWEGIFRPEKEKSRTVAILEGVFGVSLYALMLPSCGAEDIKHGMEVGTFVPGKTRFVCVDNDAANFKRMKRTVIKFGFTDSIFINSNINKVDLLSLGIKFDYGFLDIYGHLSVKYLQWIEEQLIPSLADGASMVFTSTKPRRSQKHLFNFDYTNDHLKIMRRFDIGTIGSIGPSVGHLINILSRNGLTSEFRDHPYKDKGKESMFLILLNNITKTGDVIKPKARSKRNMSKQTPIQKAWATRRANDLKTKQAEAGRKSWETRRANEKAAKQAEAGRKSWETRRANAAARG